MSTSRYTNAGGIGSGTTVDNMKSRIKAWLLATGNAQTIYDSFNVSNITDPGIGKLGINFTVTVVQTVAVASTDMGENGTYGPTPTYCFVYCNTAAGAAQDPGIYSVIVTGTLA